MYVYDMEENRVEARATGLMNNGESIFVLMKLNELLMEKRRRTK